MGIDIFQITGSEALGECDVQTEEGEEDLLVPLRKFRRGIGYLIGNDRPLIRNLLQYDESQRDAIVDLIGRDADLYENTLKNAELRVDNETVWDPKKINDQSGLSFEDARSLFESIPAFRLPRFPGEIVPDEPVDALYGLNMHLIELALALLGYYRFFGQGPGRFLTEYNDTKDNWQVTMSRNGSKVTMDLSTECYVLQCDGHVFTFNQGGNALIDCKKFDHRNKDYEIFSATVSASIDFSKSRPLATLTLNISTICYVCGSDCKEAKHGLKYVGPQSIPEIIKVENQVSPGKSPHLSPRLPSQIKESHLSPRPDSQRVPASFLSSTIHTSSEQWARWAAYNPFLLGLVGAATFEGLFIETLSLLKREMGAGGATQDLAHYSFVWGLVGGFPGSWEGMQALSKLEDLRYPRALERNASGLLNGAISALFFMSLCAYGLKNVDKERYFSLSTHHRLVIIMPPAVLVGLIQGAWYALSQSVKDRLGHGKPWLLLIMQSAASIALQVPRFSVALEAMLPAKQTMSEHFFLSLTAAVIISALELSPLKQRAALGVLLLQAGLLLYSGVQHLRSEMHADDENQISPAIPYIRMGVLALLFLGSIYPMYKSYPRRSGFSVLNETHSLLADRPSSVSYGTNHEESSRNTFTMRNQSEEGQEDDAGSSAAHHVTAPLLPQGPTSQPSDRQPDSSRCLSEPASNSEWFDDSPGPVRRDMNPSKSSDSAEPASPSSLPQKSPKSALRRVGSGDTQKAGRTLSISPELPTRASILSNKLPLWAPDSPPDDHLSEKNSLGALSDAPLPPPLTWDANRRRPSPLSVLGRTLTDESLLDDLEPHESTLTKKK